MLVNFARHIAFGVWAGFVLVARAGHFFWIGWGVLYVRTTDRGEEQESGRLSRYTGLLGGIAAVYKSLQVST